MSDIKKPKIIMDPLLGLIDITEVLPIIDTRAFQSLGYKYQLGLASNVFPAATHTRKQHSLGSYERSKRLADDWLDYGFISEKQAKHIPVFALLHDIGHGPFSHTTESVGDIDHNERGLFILGKLKERIEEAGFDYDMVEKMFNEEDPLYVAVKDKNLGTEKLDYLERDAFYTIGENPGVEYLLHHIYFINNKLVINEVAVDQAKDIQDFYIKMYKHVYTRKKAAILQRLVEKMTFYLYKDGLKEDELFDLTDFGLLGKFEASKNKKVKYHYDRFQKGDFPKLAIEFKDEKIISDSYSSSTYKPTKKIGISSEGFDDIILSEKFNSIDFVEDFEEKIAEIIGIPENTVVVVQPQSLRRFEPTDVNVYMQSGEIEKISNVYPDHFQAMREYGRSHLGLRICVYKEHREKLSSRSEKIKDLILNL